MRVLWHEGNKAITISSDNRADILFLYIIHKQICDRAVMASVDENRVKRAEEHRERLIKSTKKTNEKNEVIMKEMGKIKRNWIIRLFTWLKII